MEFYNQLGLSFQKEKHGSGPEHDSSEYENFILELYPSLNSVTDNTRLGFEVENLSSIIESMDVIQEYEFNNRKTWVVKDPDGRKVELYEKKP